MTFQFWTSRSQVIPIRGLWHDSPLWILCGGPSLTDVSLDVFHRRGVTTMAINQAWAVYRPHIWLSLDHPGNFVDVGWRDPAIFKCVPFHYRNESITEKTGSEFRKSDVKVNQLANVILYKAATTFDHNTFFTSSAAQYGVNKDEACSLGIKSCRSVLLAAVRVAYELGFRRIYLVGCDFKMSVENPYGFAQVVSTHLLDYNNKLYDAVNKRLAAVLPQCKDRGLEIRNCTPDSGLTAFPFLPLEESLVSEGVSSNDRAIDTEGWYGNPTIAKVKKSKDETLRKKRLHEQEKYRKLASQSKSYGATNHGSIAMDAVVELRPSTLIDLGCGRNQFVCAVRDRLPGVHAVGVDFAFPEADVDASMHDLSHFQSNSIDVVTAFDSLEHLLEEDAPRVMRELRRVLRWNGTFLCTIGYAPSRWKVDGEGLHPTVHNWQWWKEQLETIGSVVRIQMKRGEFWMVRKSPVISNQFWLFGQVRSGKLAIPDAAAHAESEVMEASPQRAKTLQRVTGWDRVQNGTLNLVVDPVCIGNRLKRREPLWSESFSEWAYKGQSPSSNAGVCWNYYPGAVVSGCTQVPCVIQCPVDCERPKMVGLLSPVRLRDALSVGDGDAVFFAILTQGDFVKV